MRERPILFSGAMVRALLDGTKTQTRRVVKNPERYVGGLQNCAHCCPYGQPGDRLWVREAWARTNVFGGVAMVVYREGDNRTDYGGPWKPGIHLFRRDARILLEVTAVRVERLQNISEGDAIDEGWPKQIDPGADTGGNGGPFDWYRRLWADINGPGSWEANPWVWVVEFRRIDPAAPGGTIPHEGRGE